MLVGDLWVNPSQGKILKHIRRVLSILNEMINDKTCLILNAVHASITLATFHESKTLLKRVFTGKPGSA